MGKIEALENRRLMSVQVSLVGGKLSIIGDAFVNDITINVRRLGTNKLRIDNFVTTIGEFLESAVTSIVVDLKGANDRLVAGKQTITNAELLNVNMTVLGGDGNDELSMFTTGRIDVTDGDGNDKVIAEGSQSTVRSSLGNDTYSGAAGPDKYFMGNAPDGADTFLDARDSDVFDYSQRTAPISITVNSGANDGELNENDRINNAGIIIGTPFNDVIRGGTSPEDIRGGKGDDTISGGLGGDTLSGGEGRDTIDFIKPNGESETNAAKVTLNDIADDLFIGSNDNVKSDFEFIIGTKGNDTLTGNSGPNYIEGGLGADVINGLDGSDTIRGEGADTINGGLGDDLITAGVTGIRAIGDFGNDTLTGGSGADDLAGGPGNDSVTGGASNDILGGNDGNDTVAGGGGNDNISGGIGNDTLTGDDGNDTMFGQDGADSMSGGIGNDLMVQNFLSGDDNSDFSADTLAGDAGNDTMSGGFGNDLLSGGDDNDSMDGSDGSDTVRGDNGDDVVKDLDVRDAANDLVEGGEGNDSLRCNIGLDTMRGGNGNDVLDARFSDFAQLMQGDAGNDIFAAGGGADSIRGGNDRDTMSYSVPASDSTFLTPLMFTFANLIDDANRATGVSVTLDGVANDGAAGENDATTDVEVFVGTPKNDTMTGGGFAEQFFGLAGNDSLTGNGGNDTLLGGSGKDTVFAGSGNDSVFGGADVDDLNGDAGNDTINGEDGNDLIRGNDGDDNLDGGNGTDAISGGAGDDLAINPQNGNDSVDLGDQNSANQGVIFDGTDGNDSILVRRVPLPGGVSKMIFSTSAGEKSFTVIACSTVRVNARVGNDTVIMDSSAGQVWRALFLGGDGNDTLIGGAQNDTLDGESGTDLLIGGDGIDELLSRDGLDTKIYT